MTIFITKDGKFTQTEADLAGFGYAEDTTLPNGDVLARWQAGLEAAVRHVEFGFRATSADSFDPSSVSSPVTLSVEKGRPFFAKGGVRVEKNGDSSTFIFGQINSYDPDSDTDNLEIAITDRGGSGTVSDWVVKAAGVEGPAGGVTSVNGNTGDVTVSTGRWTKEAEIDLSAQGGSFVVTDLPTSASQIAFIFTGGVSNDSGGFVGLEAQVSDDNGSSFITATNYIWETLFFDTSGAVGDDVDRMSLNSNNVIGVPDQGSTSRFNADLLLLNPGNSTNGDFTIFGKLQGRQGARSFWQGSYKDATANEVNAIKFMLTAGNFATGTLVIWSA